MKLGTIFPFRGHFLIFSQHFADPKGPLALDFAERLERLRVERGHRHHAEAVERRGLCDHRHREGQRHRGHQWVGLWGSHLGTTAGGGDQGTIRELSGTIGRTVYDMNSLICNIISGEMVRSHEH